MVNMLKEQSGNASGELSRGPLLPRSHHNWAARLGRRRDEVRREPQTLQELEKSARLCVKLMEKHGTFSENNFKTAMSLLRQQHNLNFILVCEKCNGTHLYDEIEAPES